MPAEPVPELVDDEPELLGQVVRPVVAFDRMSPTGMSKPRASTAPRFASATTFLCSSVQSDSGTSS